MSINNTSSTLREMGNRFKILASKPQGLISKAYMEDNINMDHREIGCGGMNWTNLDEDKVQWRQKGHDLRENINFPGRTWHCGNILEFLIQL